jgi:hypothetical protein
MRVTADGAEHRSDSAFCDLRAIEVLELDGAANARVVLANLREGPSAQG